MSPAEVADILIQLDRLHAVGGEDEQRRLSGSQKRWPHERGEPLGVDLVATESLPRHPFQQPGPVRTNFCPIRLDQSLELTVGGKFIEVEVTWNVSGVESPHIQELAVACGPEAVSAAHRSRGCEPGCALRLCQLLSWRYYKLRQDEQQNDDARPQFEHRSDDSGGGDATRTHRGQLSARRKAAQCEKAGEQYRRRHQLQESGRCSQQHVGQCVDQPVVPLTNVVELIDELQQAEQRSQASGHQHQGPKSSQRDVTLQQAHEARPNLRRLSSTASPGSDNAMITMTPSDAGAIHKPGNEGITPV
jgi:hypothetical protein